MTVKIREERNIELRFYKKQILPELDLEGSISANGLESAWGHAQDQVVSGSFYSWKAGIVFSYPLGGHNELSRLREQEKIIAKEIVSLKELEEVIITDVLLAIRDISANLKRIEATEKSIKLAEANFFQEKKRFELGQSTSHDVLGFQEELDSERLIGLEAKIDYKKSIVNYYKVTAMLLNKYGINIEGE